MPDNFLFDMTGVPLTVALDVAFFEHKTAIGFSEESDGTLHGAPKKLIFYWTDGPAVKLFPAPLGVDAVIPIIESWLKTAEYGNQPDHDGDNEKGFRVYNESWGHIGGLYQAFVAIDPVWLMYGK